MGAIGLNPIRLDRIGLDPIRINAIKLGVPGASGTERPYIDPEVLASLKAVCICYGKSNDDPDRAVVKNLVDPDNPFVISNAAFKLNSGFGKYEDDFTNWVAETGTKLTSDKITNSNPTKNWIAYRSSGVEFKEMHIRILGIPDNGVLYFQRPPTDGGPIRMFNGDNNIPAFTSTGICGFFINNLTGLGWSNLVIEQIPSFEGAFVTDGINDLITSTKTVQEMGITDEVTVVSMIHQIDLNSTYTIATTNYIENSNSREHVRSDVYNYGKTGIYGYSASLINNTKSDIKNILGDEADYYVKSTNSLQTIFDAKFSVVGRISELTEASQVAWYWTIIANKVLTTDQINQVIAYFNLDRTLNPDILCNTIKQGITNENHAEFGDKLIDFSGNGRDIQLNNIAWKGGSGIGKYETELSNTRIWTQSKEITSSPFSSSYNGLSGWIIFANTELTNSADMPSFKIQVKGLLEGQELIYRYYDSNGQSNVYSITKDGEYTLPSDVRTAKPQTSNTSGFQVVKNETNIITITQIPSHAGALCLDGVNDFGKVTGMPIYKDYTFIIDRQIIFIGDTAGVVASKSEDSEDATKHGAFIFEYLGAPDKISTWSFYKDNGQVANTDFTRGISYQSKYSYNGKDLTVGTSKDSDKLWLGTIRDNDSRFFNGAIYSLMSFPYSMSEFLIERQLKKHKLGTLYPNMVEFRPIVKSNLPYSSISYSVNPGEYISVDSMVTITITLPNTSDKLMEVSCNAISDISISGDNGVYEITGKVVKSPQKINLVISSYLTMLSNSTLISNETLIKNE